MALTFPRTDLLDGLSFAASTPPFKPLWRRETTRTTGGITRVAELGPMLWQATYTTMEMTKESADELEADLLSMQGGLELFEGYDPRRPFPVSDKVSALTGLTVYDINAERTEIRIEGLPNAFTLTKGDWISVDDGTNLHLMRALETVTGGGLGRTPFATVQPAVRAGINTGDSVTLRYPKARFMVTEYDRISAGPLYDTITWSAVQVIE